MAEGGEERHRLPVAVRHLGQKPLAAMPPAVGAGQVRLGPGLVDEDEPFDRKARLKALPPAAAAGDVRAILLAGVQRFF
jgi:hypothetical protein